MESKTMESSGAGSLFSTNIFGTAPSPAPVVKAEESVLTPAEKEIYDSLSVQEKSHLTSVVQGMNLALPNFTSEGSVRNLSDQQASAFSYAHKGSRKSWQKYVQPAASAERHRYSEPG